jgi:hypothetical protein
LLEGLFIFDIHAFLTCGKEGWTTTLATYYYFNTAIEAGKPNEVRQAIIGLKNGNILHFTGWTGYFFQPSRYNSASVQIRVLLKINRALC